MSSREGPTSSRSTFIYIAIPLVALGLAIILGTTLRAVDCRSCSGLRVVGVLYMRTQVEDMWVCRDCGGEARSTVWRTFFPLEKGEPPPIGSPHRDADLNRLLEKTFPGPP